MTSVVELSTSVGSSTSLSLDTNLDTLTAELFTTYSARAQQQQAGGLQLDEVAMCHSSQLATNAKLQVCNDATAAAVTRSAQVKRSSLNLGYVPAHA